MPVSRWIPAALMLSATITGALWLSATAWAQGAPYDAPPPEPPAEAAARGFESIGRALREFAGLPTGEVQAGAFRATRLIEHQFPAPDGAGLYLELQFCHLTVTGWSEPIIALDLTVHVEAATTDASRALSELTRVDITREDGQIHARAQFPKESPEGTRITLTGEVKAPHAMAIALDNAFGRSTVRGMRGPVTISHRYGAVDLAEIDGGLTLHATGAHVTTGRLGGSAALFLADSETTVAPVAGPITVQVAGGAIALAPPAEGGRIDLVGQAARVTVHDWPLNRGIEAAVIHGEITGAPPALVPVWGPMRQLRTGGDPVIRLGLTFGALHFDAGPALFALRAPPEKGRATGPDPQLYETTDEEVFAVGNAGHIVLEPGPANVRLVGEDRANIRFVRTRRIWAVSPAHASTLFDAVGAHVTRSGESLTLEHREGQTGGARYTVAWEVRFPAAMPVRMGGGTGAITVIGAGAGVDIAHAGGEVRIVGARGEVRIAQEAGGVVLEDSRGSAHIEAGNGAVHVRGHEGPLHIDMAYGNTAIENHRGKLAATAQQGDVRIICETLEDDIDVRCENGHGALLLPRGASANLDIRLVSGQIYSAIPLTGTVEQGRQAFHALLGTGEHRIRFECHGGNIRIDQAGASASPEAG